LAYAEHEVPYPTARTGLPEFSRRRWYLAFSLHSVTWSLWKADPADPCSCGRRRERVHTSGRPPSPKKRTPIATC